MPILTPVQGNPFAKGKITPGDVLDVLDPVDDKGPVIRNTTDREVHIRAKKVAAKPIDNEFDALAAQQSVKPALTPVTHNPFAAGPQLVPVQGNPFVPASTPASTPTSAAPAQANKRESSQKQEPSYLSKVEDAAIQPLAAAGRQLLAPLLSQEQRQILQQKGLLPNRAENIAQVIHQTAGPVASLLTAGLSAPIQPLIEPGIESMERKAALPSATKEKIQAGLDVASLAVPGVKPGAIAEAAGSAVKGVEKTLSPTTLTPESKAMETIIREKYGEASRSTAKNEALLAQNAKTVANMTPEETMAFYNHVEGANAKKVHPAEAEMAKVETAMDRGEIPREQAEAQMEQLRQQIPAPAPRNTQTGKPHPIEKQMAEIEAAMDRGEIPKEQAHAQMDELYKQRYASSKERMDNALPEPIKAFADDTKTIMQSMRKRLEEMPEGEKMGFVQDYFPHMWKNPKQAEDFAQRFVARQGSAAATKKRTLPTIADGLAAGLELADPNPMRAASRYINSTNNFIASKEVFADAKKAGYIKYAPAGRQPEGWVELEGRSAQLPFGQKAYAPEAVARVYNNYLSKGFGTGEAMTPYEALRKVTAANTVAELSLSGYHALTITAQNIATDIGRIIKNTAAGDWKGVAKAVKSATIGQLPGVKGGSFEVGNKFIKQYKGLADHGIDMESIVEHFEKGGGKLGQERLYRAAPEGGFFQAAQRGQLKDVFNDLLTDVKSGPLGPAKAAVNTLSKAAEDVSYPLFQYYIPRVKAGAFANLMEDWVRQNPGASEKAIADARKHILDLVDDRYGEMNMDNIFWNRYLKQIGAVMLRAQGWDIGLVRQSAGGVLDAGRILNAIRKGEGFDKKLLDRPIYLASSLMTTAMINAAYQYMKTGQPPQDIKDLILPRTGGKTKYGKPERIAPVGHPKELLHMMTPTPGEGPLSGLSETAYGKIASFPKNVYEDIAGTDFAGRPVDRTLLEKLGHVAGGFAPFSMSQQPQKGSNISGLERFLGHYPAGMKYVDPDRLKFIIEKQHRKEELAARRRNVRKQREEK